MNTNQYRMRGFDLMTEERFYGIQSCKEDYIKKGKFDRDKLFRYLRPNIARSWLRCAEDHVDPRQYPIPEVAVYNNPTHTSKKVEESRKLLEFAHTLFERFDLLGKSKYCIRFEEINPFLGLAVHEIGSSYFPTNALFHQLTNEEISPPSTHIWAKLTEKTIQMQGVEHFFDYLYQQVGTVTPIKDQNGKVFAFLSVGQPVSDVPWDSNFQIICQHTYQVTQAIGLALQNQIDMMYANHQLDEKNWDLTSTLGLIEDGIIMVANDGRILNINDAGKKMLRIADHVPTNVFNILNKQSPLREAIQNGQNLDGEESIALNGSNQRFVVSCATAFSADKEGMESRSVLCLNLASKINAESAKRAGNIANYTFSDIIGQSPNFQSVIKLGKKFANLPENILLVGESGTGKELFAQAIHNTCCVGQPFIAINCAAIPRDLIESELFGYESGSFTGANREGRPGKIELADGGTLFLDEIGDMPFELQAVLLRVLEDRQITRIGGKRAQKIDFKVIAATNKDLPKMIEDKMFRADLFYRLSVLTISIPPLRERSSDIMLLSQYFIEKYCKKIDRSVPRISPKAKMVLKGYSWPGNVRQLEHTLTYAINLAEENTLGLEHFPTLPVPSGESELQNTAEDGGPAIQPLAILEKTQIEKTLHHTDGNMLAAAELLGISKSTLYRKVQDYKIR